jgi:hypothetical protein
MSTAEITRLERKIDRLARIVEERQKPVWVKSTVISSMTGWNFRGLAKAREHGYIDFKKVDTAFWYDLNSLNEKFLVKSHP